MQVLQGLEQDFVSEQVRSLETGRDKDENHLVSKFARAPGAASVRWEGKTGRKRPERNEVFCAHGRIMYIICDIRTNWYVSTKYAYLCVRTYIYVLFNA